MLSGNDHRRSIGYVRISVHTICGPHHGETYDLDLMMIAMRVFHVNLNPSENNPCFAKGSYWEITHFESTCGSHAIGGNKYVTCQLKNIA